MNDSKVIFETIRRFVATELLDGNEEGLDENTRLLELGIIDSWGIAQTMRFIHSEFAITIPDSEIVPNNFGNLGAIVDLVIRLS